MIPKDILYWLTPIWDASFYSGGNEHRLITGYSTVKDIGVLNTTWMF